MTSRPTICHVVHSLTIGGAEMLATRLARGLADRYRFVFACLDDLGVLGEALRRDGFVVEVLGRREGIDFGCMARLGQLWRRERIAAVHAHQYTPFFYSVAARRLADRPRVLFTEHGRFFPDCRKRTHVLFNRVMLRRGDRVTSVGESIRRSLVRNEGIPAPRIEVIHNGVDLRRFDGLGVDRRAVRREIGLQDEDIVVIQVARLDPLKDHLTAIRALDYVVRQCRDARLVLVGDGPRRDDIVGDVQRLGLSDRVLMLGQRTDVARLLHAADMLLLTSVSEGIPVTILEAMAAGLPVVATDVGGVAEVVRPGETGLLARPGDDRAVADAILRLAELPSLRRHLGERGRLRAESLFSEDRMLAAYARCYEAILHRERF